MKSGLLNQARRILTFGERREVPMVNFLVCGTQKGGTTALHTYLRGHPEICVPDIKEAHFFDKEEHFASRRPDYSRYHDLFRPQPSHRILGETTPIYMYWHDAPRRIWEYNPRIRLVVLLRNPVERAFSHWNMERAMGRDRLSFWEAITTEVERCRGELPFQHRIFSYIDRGYYSEQLRRIWRYFPKSSVLVLRSEQLNRDPDESLRTICDFLGVGHVSCPGRLEVNARPKPAPMSDKEADYLRQQFQFEIKELERMLGWDCSDWLR
jgi:hypothetical protein